LTAGLILNLQTGRVTPQFHVVYDDWFETVSSENQLDVLDNPGVWERLFRTSRINLFDPEDFNDGNDTSSSNADQDPGLWTRRSFSKIQSPTLHKLTTIRKLSNINSTNNSQHQQCSSKHRNHSNSKQIPSTLSSSMATKPTLLQQKL